MFLSGQCHPHPPALLLTNCPSRHDPQSDPSQKWDREAGPTEGGSCRAELLPMARAGPSSLVTVLSVLQRGQACKGEAGGSDPAAQGLPPLGGLAPRH